MAKLDPKIVSHLEWLGFVRPTGLVVSAPALVRAGAILDEHDTEGQRLLRACLEETGTVPNRLGETASRYDIGPDVDACITDFIAFAQSVLGWRFSPKGYAGTPDSPIPSELEVCLPDVEEVLRPDFAVRELDPKNGTPSWQLLVRVLAADEDFDAEPHGGNRLDLSPHSRMERLLRLTGVPAGLLVNGYSLRLISAPRAESSGWLDFRVADMLQTGGRPILSALRMLLSEQRLLALPRHQRLAALLTESRRFQNEVSEKLAAQVLHALYELLRGFQAANDASKGNLLRDVLAEDADNVYRALLTVVLRLVFLLYAEERDMLPAEQTFMRYYSLAGLHERLREDAALYPDTMDQRFGAWAQLVTLFRIVHDGAMAPGMHLPARQGVLFDPNRFPFLEGRIGALQRDERICAPLVPDGTVYRALEKLLVLDGERISYRALDVEQIGSVYETMMGFLLETTTGRSIAIRSQKKQGAPTVIDLEAMLAESPVNRAKWLQDRNDRKLTDAVKKAVANAETIEDLHAALMSLTDKAATPDLVPKGAMVLQPSEERRRSGSHYTPRELTAPIVRTTLDPILNRLRTSDDKPPAPQAILDLKICDPAMGSGAFLVEACRYLGDALVEAWHAHNAHPVIPSDEDAVVFARRLVAQRCLYGVDRNPVAVDLAKMSLWLATLAKDHALTFLDHALRHGDSLVGLSRPQLEAFHWEANAPRFQAGLEAMKAREHLERVTELRRSIREAADSVSDHELRGLWQHVELELSNVRLVGDLTIAAWFEADKPKERETKRLEFANAVIRGDAEQYRAWLDARRRADAPLAPFHWEIEFTEVFDRKNAGFDAFIGNPPFLGGKRLSTTYGDSYRDWLPFANPESSNNADLVAHFFRRAFSFTRDGGTLGLVATNTISQGDTRASGLRWICCNGGTIYSATRRLKWPGSAAVIVSVVHIIKGGTVPPRVLDGIPVDRISAFLFPKGGDDDPHSLRENEARSFHGGIPLGKGFLFEDDSAESTPLAEMNRLLASSGHNDEAIFPYLGGEELNTDPEQRHHRFVIDFGDAELEEALRRWPALVEIVRQKVKPFRDGLKRKSYRELWWLHGERQAELYRQLAHLPRVLANSQVSSRFAFAFQPVERKFSYTLNLFLFSSYAAFCGLQARPHELWARFFGSSMKDDLRYNPSDCFETFPFPDKWETLPSLEVAGKAYYDFRAAVMVRNGEGLTKTYNRFHDPNENDPDILKLRELHDAMDREVLATYAWRDLAPKCDFFLDYEIDDAEWGERKKPYRYRWPDDVQSEVLARLLELNARRAESQMLAGADLTGKRARQKDRSTSPAQPSITDLFS